MTVLVNCTGKFYYRNGSFKLQKQPPEVFLKIPQNSQENTYARVSFLIKLQVSRLILKIWKLIYDSGRPQLADKNLFWKYLENIQEHICIRLKLWWRYKFLKLKIGWIMVEST